MRNLQSRGVLEERLKLAVTNLELWIYCIEHDKDMEKLFKNKRYKTMRLHIKSLVKCSQKRGIDTRAYEERIDVITSFAEEKAYGKDIQQRIIQMREYLNFKKSNKLSTPRKIWYDKKKKSGDALRRYADDYQGGYVAIS